MTCPNIPRIRLLCMESKFIDAFLIALAKHWPEITTKTSAPTPNTETDGDSSSASVITIPSSPINLSIHDVSLSSLSASTKFDLIVSPANSYGRLDGSFDDAISRAFCRPDRPYETLTHAAQDTLYEKYRGFAPPGSCTLVPFPGALLDQNGKGKNRWGCRWLGLCPTMRTPDDVRWDREVVYECIWSLLCAVDGWNRGLEQRDTGEVFEERIESVLMTPLATGCGMVSAQRWAEQFVLAMKHYVDAVERPQRWKRLGWGEIQRDTGEVEKTWKEKKP
ncbi:hypothetical protein BDV18DRAFT_144759 [Aspergillus unguis]